MFTREELLQHEEEAVLKTFQNDDAYKLGQKVLEAAGEKAKNISISIYKGSRQLFFLAGSETTFENEFWMERKRNVVNHHEHSSMFVRVDYNGDEEEYYRISGLNRVDYAIHGGGFPIRVENVGYVGCLAVSGLPMEEDHMICVEALKLLRKEQQVFAI